MDPTPRKNKKAAIVPRCLTMIVCNEEHVIERCLRSAAPFITTYCICYNGNGSDRTKDIIRKVMHERNIKGVIHDHTWEEFGPTRTKAFIASREHCPDGWSWVIDADDTIVVIHPVRSTGQVSQRTSRI